MLAWLSDGDGLVLAAVITAVLVPGIAAHRQAKRANREAKKAVEVAVRASAEREQFRQEMHQRIDTVQQDLTAVNHAVNNVGPNTPTLVDRVFTLEQSQAWQSGALRAIAINIGAELPPPLKPKPPA